MLNLLRIILIIFIIQMVAIAVQAEEGVASSPTPKALLQDRQGTPIPADPAKETPVATITPGPAPTPMKVAG